MNKLLRNARRRVRSQLAIRSLLLSRHRRVTAGAKALATFAAVALVAFVAVVALSGVASAADLGGLAFGPLGMLGVMGLTLPRPLIQKLDPEVTPVGAATAEGVVGKFTLQRALLYRGIVLTGTYSDLVATADATSVLTYGVPIERIDVVAENGVVLHSVRPTDLVREKQTEAQQPLASMLVPPSAVAQGAQTGSFNIPLSFSLDNVKDGVDFMLPAWRFEQVQVLVYFQNCHSNLFVVGSSTGTVTVQTFSLNFMAVVDLPQSMIADPNKLIRDTSLLLRSYTEIVQAAAANAEYEIDCPRSADIERIYIMTEDANRSPVATILNAVSLVENGQVRRLSKVPAAALRAIGSEYQQATLPTGWHRIDFMRDSDTIQAALPATKLNSLKLVLDLAAVAGKVRVVFIRKAP